MGPDRRRTQETRNIIQQWMESPISRAQERLFQSCEEGKQSRSCVHSECAVPVAHRNFFLGKNNFHHGVKPSGGISSHPKCFLTVILFMTYLQRRLDCVSSTDLTASLQRQGPEQREHKQTNKQKYIYIYPKIWRYKPTKCSRTVLDIKASTPGMFRIS